MHWISELFTQPTYLQAVLILSIISAVGTALGQVRIKGASLGVAFVFFVGILVGELADRLGIEVNREMVMIAQNFGLILFVYNLGVQVGPGFIGSFKKGGIRLNLLGLLVVATTTLAMMAAIVITGMPFTSAMGLLCGAATNTPMLGTAQQALLDIHPEMTSQASDMATACAVAYPVGVIGVLASIIIVRLMFKKRFSAPKPEQKQDTYVAEFHISNPAVFNKSIKDIASLTDKHIIISRVWRDGKAAIPSSATVLLKDDHILAVLKKDDLSTFQVIFGEQENTDWNRQDIDWNHIDESNLVSKHVVVTRPNLNGVKIGSLHLRNSFDINITRVNRAGVQLVAYPGLRLQLGDRLTVVGSETAIAKVGEILGNEEKVLHNPNLVTIFLGIILGVVLGSLPLRVPGISTPIKLGIAGGPIVIGIIMGAFGSRVGLSTYATRSANLMLRQMGIVIYLACLGFTSGAGFFETVFCMQGLVWVLVALAIAIVPVVISGFVATRWGGLGYAQNAGMICAAMANPMALTYANSTTEDDEASEAYATVYPLAMFIRVISAQILVLLMV